MATHAQPPAPSTADAPQRLTSLAHGGGCGCKIAPGVLTELLRGVPALPAPAELLVGRETSDDAAVYRLDDRQAIVATTDFFMPIVDDPFDFGRIAATNALSDLYAMGARPLFALAIVGMPINSLPQDTIRGILQGGERACADAGIVVAGGHSIDSVEPIYGLAAIGVLDPQRLKRNADARAGDVLVLGKPLGVGVYSSALKKEVLDAEGYRQMIESTTRLNSVGVPLSALNGVHAMTDVTGFGLLGHLLEVCRASGVAAEVNSTQVPLLPQALDLLQRGCVTGASNRNWASYGAEVRFAEGVAAHWQPLLTDPQTSGGLLVSCAPEAVAAVLACFHDTGFGQAAMVGRLGEGTSGVRVV
ncbi:selenide, water dikinase SelD [Stenotrophomonas maltophilia]|uniref:Selenide, water dikinase n=1 Tax=Stenotrophomonas riyadhensis TaxID=2859893 RepID=A0ABT2XGU8_9GAMM|nr:selenide, water dikinase SelD [Stenotrophomonas sp. CFS3442]MBH1618973.1 selenide, water dikinase SelD [Stenotrophomonas maltophilia]MCV0325171.1 selenide, water dikinase SelD [Stenotrophomonas sp. CFS3442]HEL4245009.1 selenide, water dikinase SelD [Stenotrophomonas maltophilia]